MMHFWQEQQFIEYESPLETYNLVVKYKSNGGYVQYRGCGYSRKLRG